MTSQSRPWENLTEGPVGRSLFAFSLPMLATTVLQSLNSSVNAVWVGHFLGEAALTATANANVILFLLLSLIFGIAMATSILVGQHLGGQRIEEAKRVIGTSLSFFLLFSVLTAAAGFLVAPSLLRWMHLPEPSFADAVGYLRVIFLALPPLTFLAMLTVTLRSAGDSRTPFIYMGMSVLLDIALNPPLIFGFGPIPALGVPGSATATLLAQAICLGLLVRHLYRRKHVLCIHRSELALLRVDRGILKLLFTRGIPMGLQMLVMTSSGLAMITLVNQFGTHTTAAFGAAQQLWTYLQMPAMAIGGAASAMAAINIGANRWDRVSRVARAGVGINFLLTGALVIVAMLLSGPLLGLFLPPDGETLAVARHINLVAAWSFLFFGVTIVLFGVVRASGVVIPALLIVLIAFWGVRIPLAIAMIPWLHEDSLWLSFPISSSIGMLLAMAYYKFGKWRMVRLTAAVPPEAA